MTFAIAADGRSALSQAQAELHSRDLQLISHLRQAAEARDPEAAAHMLRMPQYARLIARGLNLSYEQQDTVLAAVTLHDIGKLGVPDAILNKRAPLSDAERKIAHSHVRHGYAILQHGTSPLIRSAAQIALRHHERFDGTGYPDGVSGTSIPLYARIAAVADVFDALTSHRAHRAALSSDRAFEYVLSQSGLQFDPDCVEAFVNEEHRVNEIRLRYQKPDSPACIPRLQIVEQ